MFREGRKLLWLILGTFGLWTLYAWTANARTYRIRVHNYAPSANTEHKSHAKLVANHSTFDQWEIKVLTWNIEGLSSQYLHERTNAVISTILNKSADIVFCQELIYDSYHRICKALSDEYECVRGYDPDANFRYFVGMYYRKDRFKWEERTKMPFTNSRTARLLYTVKLRLEDPVKVELALMTSHLESYQQKRAVRVEQLKQSFRAGSDHPENYNVIFGGDLNLEAGEDEGVVPQNFYDLWKACGSKESVKYTWDEVTNPNERTDASSQQPKVRYDRLYFRPSKPETIYLKHFDLVGKEMVEGTSMYPSDHWGIIATFKILQKDEKSRPKCTIQS